MEWLTSALLTGLRCSWTWKNWSRSALLAPGRITSPLAFPSIMAYDEELAHRIRALLADEPGITEKAMFGGLAFLTNGNMTVSASGPRKRLNCGWNWRTRRNRPSRNAASSRSAA